jgi:hypothetical protein
VLTDMYCWDGGLAVTGPVRDIGRNVLRSAFITGSGSSSSSYCHVFLLIAVLEEAFIRCTIIIPCINCIIIICINNNNTVINNNNNNNNNGRLRYFTLFVNIPMGKRKDFFEIYKTVCSRALTLTLYVYKRVD